MSQVGSDTLLTSRLRQSGLAQVGIFNQAYIDRLLDEHLSARTDHSYRLWLLLCLEFWFDIFIGGASVPSLQQAAADTITGNR